MVILQSQYLMFLAGMMGLPPKHIEILHLEKTRVKHYELKVDFGTPRPLKKKLFILIVWVEVIRIVQDQSGYKPSCQLPLLLENLQLASPWSFLQYVGEVFCAMYFSPKKLIIC